MNHHTTPHLLAWTLVALALAGPATPRRPEGTMHTMETRYARIRIDEKGFITSIASRRSGKEYSPSGHPSPLLSLSDDGRLISPTSAAFDAKKGELDLHYPSGQTAVVKVAEKGTYFRFQLVSLSPRGTVDNIVWGPIHTTVSKKIGDLIGVVRDDAWAIGLMGLDDNTIAGPPVDGDCYQMGYYVHSPDPVAHPVPPQYKEGQRFSVGGDGTSDVAFYSHPEEYFQQNIGTGAILEPDFGSSLSYHSRDRRKPYTYFFSLLPGFDVSRPHHQVTDPLDADFIGSTVALYACPDDQGLSVIESIILPEGLPHITVDGKWIRESAAQRPDVAWYGPHDKLIEYADALGLKAVQDEGLGEYYANPADRWAGKRVGFSDGHSVTIKEFTDEAHKHGIRYGLHTLAMFIQPHSSDVKPVPNEHLQTVLRTKLASNIAPEETAVAVTEPSFLAEKGTWHGGPGGNVLRIGKELLTYEGIGGSVLQGVKRGQYGTAALAHSAGDELVKLQMNCYHGFVPDMQLLMDYADYYARLFHDGGMQYVDFDGLESTIYQNHGYYAVRRFYRRLFDTYQQLTGGDYLRVMGSCVFPGAWEYMSVCNVGGGNNGNNMFDPILNRWGIEGKDIRNAFGNSYFPPTFGIQDYHSDWTVCDVENLQAKSIGYGATYMLGLSEDAVEKSGEKAAIFKAFRTWEDARAAGVFTSAVKKRLRDLEYKFHLEQTGKSGFVLHPVKETMFSGKATGDTTQVHVANPFQAQPLSCSIRVLVPVSEVELDLPDGSRIRFDTKVASGQFVVIGAGGAYLADQFRRKLADLPMRVSAAVPKGESTIGVRFPGTAHVPFELRVWTTGQGERAGR